MSGVSIWVVALTIYSANTFAGETNEPLNEQITVRPSLAAHLGLVKGLDVTFGTPRDFRSSAFDSSFELQPMTEDEAEEADRKADLSEEITDTVIEDSISANAR